MPLKIGYQVTKCHPYISDGDTEAQCFMALVRELAGNPTNMYNLEEDKVIYHKCPKTGNRFKIELIFKGG